MKRIAQDIKSAQFSHLYLLYGEEAYLRRQYRDKLRAALVPADDTMNCSVYSGKDINASEVVDLAGTMPFFAERRVIIIENSGWLKSGNDQFLALVKAIPDTTYLILVEEETDKRSKLYKAVTANGYAALCEMQDEATLRKWVMGLLKKENKLITPDALTLLLDKTGTSMENIRREVEKLVCYKYYDEGITASDVEELCIVQIQNQIFDMVEAVAQKKQKQALKLYYNLLALKEAPMKILALIARQFNMLLQVKEMKTKGYHESDIAKQTGLNPYYLKKKYIPQAAQFKQAQLETALKACVEAEEAVKTGRMPDLLSVELIIVSLSTD
ncbi:MAG: DNA polymerase III subunit delta [Lachnospiraceae bacterium]|nr:DNA polymerase III subunit delta [Lachnospiraceae bacterium]